MHGKKVLIVVAALVLALALAMATVVAASPLQQEGESPYCNGGELEHPVALRIAAKYAAAEYADVIDWYCEGFGFGQIMLALQTAEIAPELNGETVTAQTLLDMRRPEDEEEDELGWGQIWQKLGLIGRPEDAGPPGENVAPQAEGPPDTIPPDKAGGPHGDRPPSHAGETGRPDHAGTPGPPDHAGPPDTVPPDQAGGKHDDKPPEEAGPPADVPPDHAGEHGPPEHANGNGDGPPDGEPQNQGGNGPQNGNAPQNGPGGS